MEIIGGLSGAALGYIHGNTRGAIKGYFAGRKLAQNSSNMPPIPRKRKSDSGGNPGTKRLKTTSANVRKPKSVIRFKVARKNRPSVAYAMGGRSGNSNAAFVSKRRGKARIKKQKSVKISRQFKTAVRKAVSGTQPVGYYRKIYYEYYGKPGNDVQGNVVSTPVLFDPIRMAEAQAVLWGNMTPIKHPLQTDIVNPEQFQTKMKVLNSWATYDFKNVTQRTYHLKIFLCKPKKLDNVNDPKTDWVQGMVHMNLAGCNPQNNTPDTMYMDPRPIPQFADNWTVETQKIVLGPGQNYRYVVQGPNDYVMNYAKMYDKVGASIPLNRYQRFARQVMFTYYPDLVMNIAGGGGHFAAKVAAPGTSLPAIVTEVNEHFRLECPENVGTYFPTAPTAGSIWNDNLKRDVMVTKMFSDGGNLDIVDVVEENPITIITNPY